MTNNQVCPLVKLLDRIRSYPGPGTPIVVFDLDSTLFVNSGRTLAVFSEWMKGDTKYQFQIKTIHPRSMKWSIDADLIEAGISKEDLEGFTEFWLDRFFNNEIIRIDRPMPGAAAYVHKVLEAGAHIIYATGRDEPRMGAGTKESLRKYGFPMDMENVTLIMKQDPVQADVDFKKNVKQIIEEAGTPIAFFEDHPDFANTFQNQFPDATIILMNLPHPPDSPKLLPRIKVINDFLFPEDALPKYLVVMSGLPATGKSTVAGVLSKGLKAKHISTDKIRADLYPSEKYDRETKYSDHAKKKVYTLLYENAEGALDKGESVVMDGTFLRNTRDGLLDLANNHNAQLVFVKTTCPEVEISRRMVNRKTHSDYFSEAYENVYEQMKTKLSSPDGRHLDIEDDPIVVNNEIPLIIFDTGNNTVNVKYTKNHSSLCEYILVDFPLYTFSYG